MVLLLEDNAERIATFRAALGRLAPGVRVHIWMSAHAMMAEAGELLAEAKLISLDHDLVAPHGSSDPGDGLDVARFLVGQEHVRPVIVHSSNSERAQMMMGEFELAGWPCVRVAPIGSGWIDEDWAVEVRRLLVAKG